MNNVLISLRKIMVILTFMLFSALMFIIPSIQNIYNYLIGITILILFVLLMKEFLGKGNIYDNMLFNGAFVISLSYILITIVRSLCDNYIIVGNDSLMSNVSQYKMIFLNSNAIYILAITISLIMYNILIMIGDKTR